MRRTSPQTTTLIQTLVEFVVLGDKVRGSHDYVAILFELGETGEPAAIPHLVPLLLSTKPEIAAAAATALHKLILATPITDYPSLDEAMRAQSVYSRHHLYEWFKLTPQRLDALKFPAGTSTSIAGLASFHHSGYVRQAAIRKLAPITTGAELPFLILRLNDWVTTVRNAAYEAIRARLRVEYCRKFIDNFTLLKRLQHAERADHKELLVEINELLQSGDCRAALLQSLQSEDRLTQRAGFKLALDIERPDLDHVVILALTNNDVVIRLRAAQRIASAFEDE